MVRPGSTFQTQTRVQNAQKHTRFKRRKETITKKLFELTTMCDVKAGMVCFGPDGAVDTWPDHTNLKALIGDYREKKCREEQRKKEKSRSDSAENPRFKKDENWVKVPNRDLIVKIDAKLKAVTERIDYLKFKNEVSNAEAKEIFVLEDEPMFTLDDFDFDNPNQPLESNVPYGFNLDHHDLSPQEAFDVNDQFFEDPFKPFFDTDHQNHMPNYMINLGVSNAAQASSTTLPQELAFGPIYKTLDGPSECSYDPYMTFDTRELGIFHTYMNSESSMLERMNSFGFIGGNSNSYFTGPEILKTCSPLDEVIMGPRFQRSYADY